MGIKIIISKTNSENRLFIFFILFNLVAFNFLNAQSSIVPPIVTYSTSQSYNTDTAIDTIFPLVTQGIVGNKLALNMSNTIVSSFAGNGTNGNNNGNSSNASFGGIAEIGFDNLGNAYVADFGNHQIRKISEVGVVSTYTGSAGPGYQDGNLQTAKFLNPVGLVFDNDGNMFISDSGNRRIRKIDLFGNVTTFAGSGSSEYVDGQGINASFALPQGLTIDNLGNIYVADGNKIRKIDQAGVVTTLAGSNSPGNVNGFGSMARFGYPNDVEYDLVSNALYVADTNNCCIRKVSLDGNVTTFAGNGSGYADGIGSNAKFGFPLSIDSDDMGNFYISDTENNVVRKITQDGIVSTIAGNTVYGYQNGIGGNVMFPRCYMITAHNSYLYVGDDFRIRKLTPMGYSITPDLPSGMYFNRLTGEITGIPVQVTPSTTYTVVAANGGGSNPAFFTFGTSIFATLSDVNFSSVTSTGAILSAEIISEGTFPIIGRGFCWSLSPGATINDANVVSGSGAGLYTSSISNLIPNKTYFVRAFATNSENTVYSSEISFRTLPNPTTLTESDCNKILHSFNEVLTAIPVTNAELYRFRIQGDNVNLAYDTLNNEIRLTDIQGLYLQPNTVYNISVAVQYENVFSEFGANCSVKTPAAIYTSLIPSHCGTTLSSASAYLTANRITSATSYKFLISNNGVDKEYISASRQIRLTDVPGLVLTAGANYNVRVAIGQGGQYHPYGGICNVVIPTFFTKLIPLHCGASLYAPNSFITAQRINSATTYKFRIESNNSQIDFDSEVRQIRLTDVPGLLLAPGNTYDIRVAVVKDGIVNPYGDMCSVTIPLIYTKLIDSHCGSNLIVPISYLTADRVNGATGYRFRVSQGSQEYYYDSPVRQFRLTDVPGLVAGYGQTYQVSVSVIQNGLYHPYGEVCSVTTSALYTKLIAPHCGSTITVFNSYLTADRVIGATGYRFRVSQSGQEYYYDSPVRQFRLTDVPGLVAGYGQTYQVSVAVIQNGLYHPYGEVCSVTLEDGAPLTFRTTDSDEHAEGLAGFDAFAYPVPFEDYCTISFTREGEGAVRVLVYDLHGRVVEDITTAEAGSVRVGSGLAASMYHVVVTQGTNSKSLKIIKK